MVRCAMCGMDVPMGRNGRCFVGHPLDAAVPAAPAKARRESKRRRRGAAPDDVVADVAAGLDPAGDVLGEPAAVPPAAPAAVPPTAPAAVPPAAFHEPRAPQPVPPAPAREDAFARLLDEPPAPDSTPADAAAGGGAPDPAPEPVRTEVATTGPEAAFAELAAAVQEADRAAGVDVEEEEYPIAVARRALDALSPYAPDPAYVVNDAPVFAPGPDGPPNMPLASVAPEAGAGSPSAVAPSETVAPSHVVATPTAGAPEDSVLAPSALATEDVIAMLDAPRRRSRRRPLAMLVVAALVLAGPLAWFVFGPGKGSAEAAYYQRLFTADETHRYSLSMNMDGTVSVAGQSQPMNAGVTMTMTERVEAVDAEGVATVVYTFDSVSVSANGVSSPVPVGEDATITARIARDGKVLSVEGADGMGLGDLGPAAGMFGPDSFGPLLPADKVAPGDEWTATTTTPNPFTDEPIEIVAKNRLERIGVSGGRETAVVRSEMRMPMDMRLTVKEMLEHAATMGGGAAMDAGEMPDDAVFVYAGDMTMTQMQTIDRETGRPIDVNGDGRMNVTFRIEGAGAEIPEFRMDMAMTVRFTEVDTAV